MQRGTDNHRNPATSEFARLTKGRFMALPRYGTADEIAALVASLAGPESFHVTESVFSLTGDMSPDLRAYVGM